MIYPTDFVRNPKKLDFGVNQGGKGKEVFTIRLGVSQPELVKTLQTDKDVDESVLIRYLNNSTVHGFRYLTDPTIRRTERYVMVVLIVLR